MNKSRNRLCIHNPQWHTLSTYTLVRWRPHSQLRWSSLLETTSWITSHEVSSLTVSVCILLPFSLYYILNTVSWDVDSRVVRVVRRHLSIDGEIGSSRKKEIKELDIFALRGGIRIIYNSTSWCVRFWGLNALLCVLLYILMGLYSY